MIAMLRLGCSSGTVLQLGKLTCNAAGTRQPIATWIKVKNRQRPRERSLLQASRNDLRCQKRRE